MKNFVKQLTQLLSASRRARPGAHPDKPCPDGESRNERIFKRIGEVMARDKPYLDEDLDLEGLSSLVLANQAYVSNAINSMSGTNFRTFLNGYRIRHCIGLLEDNAGIRISDAAVQSGFRSLVTFNDAFKKVTGVTPTVYVRKMKARKTGPAR